MCSGRDAYLDYVIVSPPSFSYWTSREGKHLSLSLLVSSTAMHSDYPTVAHIKKMAKGFSSWWYTCVTLLIERDVLVSRSLRYSVRFWGYHEVNVYRDAIVSAFTVHLLTFAEITGSGKYTIPRCAIVELSNVYRSFSYVEAGSPLSRSRLYSISEHLRPVERQVNRIKWTCATCSSLTRNIPWNTRDSIGSYYSQNSDGLAGKTPANFSRSTIPAHNRRVFLSLRVNALIHTHTHTHSYTRPSTSMTGKSSC